MRFCLDRMWGKMNEVVAKIEQARAGRIDVSADMYPYTAGATALGACLPPWAHAGGAEKTLERLREPALHSALPGRVIFGPGYRAK